MLKNKVNYSGWIVFIAVFILSGCAQLSEIELRRGPIKPTSTSQESGQKSEEKVAENTESPKVSVTPPKLGVLLSAGGMKAYAHLGVLEVLERKRIPVHAIVGLEWGAVIAALYAQKGSANQAQWQMLKLKRENVFPTQLFGSSMSAQSVEELQPFLEQVLANSRVEDLSLPLSCPTQDLADGRVEWVRKGLARKEIEKCLAYPPFFKPRPSGKRLKVSAPAAIEEAVEELQRLGAEAILFVDALGPGSVVLRGAEKQYSEQLLWLSTKKSYDQWSKKLDNVVRVYSSDSKVEDFDQRRHFLRLGKEAGRQAAQRLIDKYNY